MKYEHIVSFDLGEAQEFIELLDEDGVDAFLAELRLYYMRGHHHIIEDTDLAEEISGYVVIDDQYVAWCDRDNLKVGIACCLIH